MRPGKCNRLRARRVLPSTDCSGSCGRVARAVSCPVNRMTEGVGITRGRGGRPLYVQLADEIAHGIREGALRPGDRVASEPELVRRHGVSRATAVRALEHLEKTGLVRREQGRGTFVEEPRLVQRDAQ